MNIFRKFSIFVLLGALIISLIVYGWDMVSDAEETWVSYNVKEGEIIIENTYTTIEECSADQNRNSTPPFGCRRVDGPYNMINKIADLAFPK